MIINRTFILERLAFLIRDSIKANTGTGYRDKMGIIKKLPLWIRKSCVFMMVSGAVKGYRSYKIRKNSIFYRCDKYTADFIDYCFSREYDLDTKYFSPEDDAGIINFIDNRLKSLIIQYEKGGLYPYDTMTTSQERDRDLINRLRRSARKTKNRYVIKQDGNSYYYLNEDSDIYGGVIINHYGLKFLSPQFIKYIEGKDFVDGGAYFGDTSIMLLSYKPKMIYAYEPVFYDMLSNITRQYDKITCVNKGLGGWISSQEISVNGSGSSLNTAFLGNTKKVVNVTDIDSECEDRGVGLIKLDVEGLEYSVIKGALETIKRDRPLLLISVYHTGKDFFEIPPLIQQAVPSYRFRYFDMRPSDPVFEKIFIAYDSERIKV